MMLPDSVPHSADAASPNGIRIPFAKYALFTYKTSLPTLSFIALLLHWCIFILFVASIHTT
jgi:hypothetical protein